MSFGRCAKYVAVSDYSYSFCCLTDSHEESSNGAERVAPFLYRAILSETRSEVPWRKEVARY